MTVQIEGVDLGKTVVISRDHGALCSVEWCVGLVMCPVCDTGKSAELILGN